MIQKKAFSIKSMKCDKYNDMSCNKRQVIRKSFTQNLELAARLPLERNQWIKIGQFSRYKLKSKEITKISPKNQYI